MYTIHTALLNFFVSTHLEETQLVLLFGRRGMKGSLHTNTTSRKGPASTIFYNKERGLLPYKLAQMMTVSGDKHQISYIFPCQRRTLLLENSFGGPFVVTARSVLIRQPPLQDVHTFVFLSRIPIQTDFFR